LTTIKEALQHQHIILQDKKKLKFLGALSRVRLYYPPTSGGIELTQERGILVEIYIGKTMQIES